MSNIFNPEESLEEIARAVLEAADVSVITARTEDEREAPCVALVATCDGVDGASQTIKDGERRYFAWQCSLAVGIVVDRKTAATDLPTMLQKVRSNLRFTKLRDAAIADATVAHNIANAFRETGSDSSEDSDHNQDTYTLTFTGAVMGAKQSAIDALED